MSELLQTRDTGTATRMEENLEGLAGSGQEKASGPSAPNRTTLRLKQKVHMKRVKNLRKIK